MEKGTKIALSLGGNLGDVSAVFDQAICNLEDEGLCEIRRSSIYRTPPIGCASETPDFLNMCVTGMWEKTPEELLQLCKKLEVESGRPADHLPYSSRTLDMDIVLFGDMIISRESLTVPHPEVKKRFFVLIPLVELAPDWKYPGEECMLKDILEKLKTSDPEGYEGIKRGETQ
jgi:2-amino-4-hydroxy-6-hydroxymethyldihydropteridine diphosphokinase